MGKRRTKSQKKALENAELEDEDLKKAPHTFVFQRGPVGKNLQQFTMDMRRVMEPFTASNLKIRKSNVMKDFVSVAGPLGVSHFIVLSKSSVGNNMRIACLPHGPTLTFRIDEYALKRDITESLKRPQTFEGQYKHSPLLVLNNFNTPPEAKDSDGFKIHPHKLCSTVLQNMFPSLNINKVHLNHVKRCVLFNYNAENNSVEFRHYNIAVKPVGVSRRMKKLISRKKIPHLGKYKDISEFLLQQGDGSASESEPELEYNQEKVELPQDISGKGNIVHEQSAIKLTEIGPRCNMSLLKIEEGMCEGQVLFHRYLSKTPEELAELEKKRENKKKLKQKRKQQQEENIKKKENLKEEHKQKSLAGMKRKAEENGNDGNNNNNAEEDDDIEWYKKEVGEEPTEDLFANKKNKKSPGIKKKSKTKSTKKEK